jgi:hypothetical protein
MASKPTVANHPSILKLKVRNYFCGLFILFLVLPRIVPFHFDVPIFAGQTTQVTCLVSEGDSPLDIAWSFQGTELSSQMGISTVRYGQKASALLIDPASSGHRGNYTCTVRNRAGSVNYTANLDVHGMLNVGV